MISFKVKLERGDRLFNLKWWPQTRKEWLPVLLVDNKKYWVAQTSPEGIPWKPLSSKYKKWKSAHYGDQPILRATGNMQDKAEIKSWGNRIFVRSSEVGPYHQFGTSKMTARPWMGVPDTSLIKLSELACKNILK